MTIRSIGPLLCGGLLVLAATTSGYAQGEKTLPEKPAAAVDTDTGNIKKQVPIAATKSGDDTTLSGVKKVETKKE